MNNPRRTVLVDIIELSILKHFLQQPSAFSFLSHLPIFYTKTVLNSNLHTYAIFRRGRQSCDNCFQLFDQIMILHHNVYYMNFISFPASLYIAVALKEVDTTGILWMYHYHSPYFGNIMSTQINK